MRKTYSRPAITAEDVLEQTSLACNASALPQYGAGPFCPNCGTVVTKGGNYHTQSDTCTIRMTDEQVVVMS